MLGITVMNFKVKDIPLHASVGVYASQSYKVNGVKHRDIQAHIKYNLENRPGRALFIDGKCLNSGNLSEAEVIEWTAKLGYDAMKRFKGDPNYNHRQGEPIYRRKHATIPYQ